MAISTQLKSENIQSFIRDGTKNQFDLLIIEQCVFHPLMALAEVFAHPTLQTHSIMGNNINPIVHPEPLKHSQLPGELSFMQRIGSLMTHFIALKIVFPIFEAIQFRYMKNYFPSVKASQLEIEDRVALLIMNTNPSMGSIRPTVNSIQESFLHIEPPKALVDEKIKGFVESSENGFIYISFGSIASSSRLNNEKLKNFVNVFSKLKFNVVWKFENDSMQHKPKNVFISKWVPQTDLLAHPNIKLFITHGGMSSIQESIDRTVPMILIPLAFNQHFNSRLMEAKEVGFTLDFSKLTENLLVSAINEVLQPKYKKNIIKLRELVYDQPMTSRETAVWWIEHIIQHKGADHLKYAGKKVPFYQKYCLDIIFTILLAAIAFMKLFKRIGSSFNVKLKKC